MESADMELHYNFGYKALREKVSKFVTHIRMSSKDRKALDACQRRLKPNKEPYVLMKDVEPILHQRFDGNAHTILGRFANHVQKETYSKVLVEQFCFLEHLMVGHPVFPHV